MRKLTLRYDDTITALNRDFPYNFFCMWSLLFMRYVLSFLSLWKRSKCPVRDREKRAQNNGQRTSVRVLGALSALFPSTFENSDNEFWVENHLKF